MGTIDLSIVIVNWNSGNDCVDCVSSICSSLEGLGYEIIVVDNASSDHSCQVLETLPSARLIRSADNIGFARANNLGAQHSSGKAILFLNPDTKILGNAIQVMHLALDSFPSIGAVGCKLLNADLSIQTSCIQPFPTIWNQATDIEWLKRRWPRLRIWGFRPLFEDNGPRPRVVEAVSGACLLVARDIFEKVGGFSTEYFMYCEELDLCYKMSRAGYKVCYVGDASVVHYGGQSTKKKREDGFEHVVMRQSIYTFLRKWKGRGYAGLYRLAMGFSAVARLFLLSVAVPVRLTPIAPGRIHTAFRKWRKVLTWCLGFERWAGRLGSSGKGAGVGVS